MAIQSIESGLWTPQAPTRPQHELLWQPGTPDVKEATGVTLEMLEVLGGVNDANREAVEQEVQTSFSELAELGYDGRLRVVPSPANMRTETLMQVAEGKRPEGVAEMHRWWDLWTPDTRAESYTEADLDGSRTRTVAQLAVFTSALFGSDKTLHFLDLPYDEHANEYYNAREETTQLDAFAADKAEAEARHQGFEVTMTDHRAYLVDALMARIQGIDTDSEEFPLNRVSMRLPAELGRRSVGGASVVGVVHSRAGRLGFDGSGGNADNIGGVGLSVEKTEAAT